MNLKKKFQNAIISFLEKRYPGVRAVVDLLEKVRERVEKQYVEGLSEVDAKKGLTAQTKDLFSKPQEEDEEEKVSSIFKPEDGKYRPVLLTLGLLYKLQKVSDDDWYDDTGVFVQDHEKIKKAVELLAKYWWFSIGVAKSIRGDEKDLYKNIAEGLSKPVEDILFAYSKDADQANVDEHCPDIAIVVDHEKKEVVFTVCGTKMFPVPSVADILMDLYCNNVPFHQGRAHEGMAKACTNIISMTLDTLVTKLEQMPQYTLLIVGYSLGAGVAQLLTIELTQGASAARVAAVTKMVKCITFGAPPVYLHSSPGFVIKDLVSVYNHNDGLASLSIHTVTKLFLQIRALNRLGIGRRRTFRLLRRKLGQTVETPGNSGIRTFVTNKEEREREWGDIQTAVKAVDKTGFHPLDHFAGETLLLKRLESKQDKKCASCCSKPQEPEESPSHLVRKFVGVQAAPLAKELRLRGGMFNDHMPWGYASLFEGHGGDTSGLTLDMITHI